MNPLFIKEICGIIGGEKGSEIADAQPITAICTDTRRMEPGSLFVAIRGDHHDGHAFLLAAMAGGAVAAVVDESLEHALPHPVTIRVPDTRIALGQLAAHVRRQMKGTVIGVAGSNGKTSTKHLIDAALRRHLRGSISPKSYNNDIGVPLTIFPADPLHDYLVLEIGTNHPGEIRRLAEMAAPDIAVITNCGAEHLEFLGDLSGVCRENAAIIHGLNPDGLLIVNGDDAELLEAVENYRGRRVTFGFAEGNDIVAAEVACTETGTHFRLRDHGGQVFVPMLGRHTASNALAAIAVARELNVPEEVAIESLASARGPEMRLQWQSAGNVRLLNDAYNANPNSMRAALETVGMLETAGRRIAVLGDMKELGASSERYHREIGNFAATAGKVDLLICVGPGAKSIGEGGVAAGLTPRAVLWFDTAGDAAGQIPSALRDGDLVLIKASRSLHLEEVAQAIAKQHAPCPL